MNSESENVSRAIREQIRHPENVRRLRALPAFAVKDETIPTKLRVLLNRLEMAEHAMLDRGKSVRDRVNVVIGAGHFALDVACSEQETS